MSILVQNMPSFSDEDIQKMVQLPEQIRCR